MLKTLRKDRGLTQTQLAKRARTSQAYIARLERGEKKNPSLAMLRRLAKALGTTIEALVA
jgi:transcriptional regulator with XRE-family HTH domain